MTILIIVVMFAGLYAKQTWGDEETGRRYNAAGILFWIVVSVGIIWFIANIGIDDSSDARRAKARLEELENTISSLGNH